MRKMVTKSDERAAALDPKESWLDVEQLAVVEISSEDVAHPIEAALVDGDEETLGWRAGERGAQTIRLYFDEPQNIRRIWLEVVDAVSERTQEIAISWTNASDERREVLRQRWNFSPAGSTREHEDYRCELRDVAAIEISIDPDVGNAHATATLRRLRLA